MAVPPSPIAVASAATRNLVPLVGIVFLGWSGANVLLLYFLDTLLAMAVMFAGLARHFMPPAASESLAARVNAEAGCIAVALFLAAFMAVPLGMPLFILSMASGVTWHSVTDDPMFRSGLVLQAIAAFWSCFGLYRALRTHTPEELRLKRQFALVFLRWIAVLMVWYLGAGFLFGRWAPVVFVAVYAAATIMIEVAPDQFLRVMPGGAEDAEALRGNAGQVPPIASPEERPRFSARWRHRHRHDK
jgi:hypothetical protein